MTREVAEQWTRVFLRALGDELRQARKQHGLSRKDLLDRAALDISLQTVATYELGTRQCTVARLVELAAVIDEPNLALGMLARALKRATQSDAEGLSLDLVTAAQTKRAELAPLRRWADCRLRSLAEGQRTVVKLSMPALEHLAELCGLTAADLICTLGNLRQSHGMS